MSKVVLRRVLVALTGALLGAAGDVPAAAASFPTHLRFESLTTSRVTLHYHQGLESTARRAAALADEILRGYETRYDTRVGRVQIVLADVQDDPNGFATPLPYPLVHIRAASPDGTDVFGNFDDWLRLVLTHELAHIVHLGEARGLFRFGRKVFGRAPFLFPNLLTPTWMIEGLATYEETRGTSFGRGRNPDSRMVLRMAALEGALPGEDRPVLGLDLWPGGQTPYLFGESFLRDISERYGEQSVPELSRVHAGRPVPFLDDLTSKRVTGASIHKRWREWQAATRVAAETHAARHRRAGGSTPSVALTNTGVRHRGPRFSPDGRQLAYTAGTLTRYTAIRVMACDGSGDRKLVDRAGGDSLAWTPDSRGIVYDEPEVHGFFALRSGLRHVQVDTGRVRWIARGIRARDPDVSRAGRIVFVRRGPDRSELAAVDLDGGRLEVITSSPPRTEWSGPRWSPDARTIVAARWTPGGWLDVVLVHPDSGRFLRELTHDRAKDVEPFFTPDGRHVVFRSDRDGVSNLYAVPVTGGPLRRLTHALGGAFAPGVAPDGQTVAFANYSSRGFDVHVAALNIDAAPLAESFVDSYPPAPPAPPPAAGPVRSYRPWGALLPRFWSPYVASFSGETRVGAFTAGFDPLFRHVYGLEVHRGSQTRRWGVRGFYRYDRLFPTILATGEDLTEPLTLEGESLRLRTRSATLRFAVPLQRTTRVSQELSLSWRGERQEVLDRPDLESFQLGGLELAWSLASARRYPFSISPIDGHRLRVAYLQEDPAFGSDVSLGKLTADARTYLRLGASAVLALRTGGGTTFGRRSFERSYALGGFPEGGVFDLVLSNPGVLRGHTSEASSGRHLAYANLEFRFPLARPQRGWRVLPVFLRHLHGAVFVDAGQAWTGRLRLDQTRTGIGLALGADLFLGHALPLTATAGIAQGFGAQGRTRGYFHLGLSF